MQTNLEKFKSNQLRKTSQVFEDWSVSTVEKSLFDTIKALVKIVEDQQKEINTIRSILDNNTGGC